VSNSPPNATVLEYIEQMGRDNVISKEDQEFYQKFAKSFPEMFNGIRELLDIHLAYIFRVRCIHNDG
jgi:hypothetical protein